MQIESKAVQSIRAKVTNILDWLPEMDMMAFKQTLLTGIFGGKTIPTYDLEVAEWEKVREMKAARYDTWEWNNGRSPRCVIHKKTATHTISIHLERGCIQAIDMAEGAAGSLDFSPVIGLRYQRQEIEKKLIEQGLNATALLNHLF
jgi:lipoate-protein ligase A